MAVEQIDPGTLDGDALRRWYLRSPADIERERQDAAAQRYQDFIGDSWGVESEPTFVPRPHEADEGFRTEGAEPEQLTDDTRPSFTWVAAGPDRFRRIPAAQGGSAPSPYHPTARPASPLIHVAAHPNPPISVGGHPQVHSSHPTYANNGGQSQIA